MGNTTLKQTDSDAEGRFDLSPELLHNLKQLWLENNLIDCTVEVEGNEFGCHRIVLYASSSYFRELLGPEMKQAKTSHIFLMDISALTFKYILNSLYDGKFTLLLENFIEIWKAVYELKMTFMLTRCELFALKVISIDNFKEIWKTSYQVKSQKVLDGCESFTLKKLSLSNFDDTLDIAKVTGSQVVLNALMNFMLNNFDAVCRMQCIVELPLTEFQSLVENHYLKVSSEDLVLETVLKWVEYKPVALNSLDEVHKNHLEIKEDSESELYNVNRFGRYKDRNTRPRNVEASQCDQRKNSLVSLLKSLRTCFVSTALLKEVCNHHLIVENNEAKAILFEALVYKTSLKLDGQWPTAATYRACSDFENSGITYVSDGRFLILNAGSDSPCMRMKEPPFSLDVTLVVFDGKLYATGVKFFFSRNSDLYVFDDNTWNIIAEIPGRQVILVPSEIGILILNKKSTKIFQIFPNNKQVKEFSILPRILNVTYAFSYNKNILIFCSEKVNESVVNETVVYRLNIKTRILEKISELKGPAENLVSFRDDVNTYILQANGNLWMLLESDEKITFQFVHKLWDSLCNLYGALTYRNTLIICGPEEITSKPKDLFKEVKHIWPTGGVHCSNFIPVVLPKGVFSQN